MILKPGDMVRFTRDDAFPDVETIGVITEVYPQRQRVTVLYLDGCLVPSTPAVWLEVIS
jgi:hypothetical protein